MPHACCNQRLGAPAHTSNLVLRALDASEQQVHVNMMEWKGTSPGGVSNGPVQGGVMWSTNGGDATALHTAIVLVGFGAHGQELEQLVQVLAAMVDALHQLLPGILIQSS